MDKYEYNLKLDEIKKLVTAGNYEDACKIADTIEWKRVRNTRTLCMISEIYEANGKLEDSKEILLRAYRRSQMTRTVLYRLTEVAIKMKEFDEAVEYYSEFVNAAPNDSSRYILKYKIYKGRGSSLEDQIAILEEYKEVEYTEQWGYELAKLYYQAGDKKKCVENCDDLVLWFRQGKYVIKALELKKSITELTPVQQSIYAHREENLMPIKERVEAAVPELERIIVDKMPTSQTDAITDNIISETQRELAQAVSQHAAEANHDIPDQSWRYSTPASTGGTKVIPTEEVKQVRNEISDEQALDNGEDPIQEIASSEAETVSQDEKQGETVSKDQDASPMAFDTLQLQRELAESMREIISGINRTENEGDIVEPKNDLSSFHNNEMEVQGPEKQNGASIDDILVSMSTGKTPEAGQSSPVESLQEEKILEKAAPREIQPARENRKKDPVKEMPQAGENIRNMEQTGKDEREAQPVRENRTPEYNAAYGAAYGVDPAVGNYAGQQPERRQGVGLTLSQQHLFSYFSTIQGLQEQIASALNDSILKVKKDKTSRSGNLVITGDPGSGRTTLGIRFAKALSLERGAGSARVAKIYGEDLNKKDIASTIAKIAGGTLIIEEAGDLAEEVVAQLSKAMEFRTDSLLVILEDEKSYLKELFERYPFFAEKFTSEISIPIMTNDELVTFGKIYAYDEDYRIDDSAMVALYNRISELQTPEHPVCIADVRDIVDEAIRRSEKAGFRKISMILSHKRYDDDDRVILYEKDFK